MWTYAQVETALAQLHHADAEAQRGAMRGRIKHFQRLGVPLGNQPGRGKRIEYGLAEIFQFTFCLELAEFGMDPTAIKQLLERYWTNDSDPDLAIKTNFFLATADTAEEDRTDNDLYFSLAPAMMAQAWTASSSNLTTHYRWIRRGEMGLLIDNIFDARPRAALINVSAIVRNLRSALPRGEDGFGS